MKIVILILFMMLAFWVGIHTFKEEVKSLKSEVEDLNSRVKDMEYILSKFLKNNYGTKN